MKKGFLEAPFDPSKEESQELAGILADIYNRTPEIEQVVARIEGLSFADVRQSGTARQVWDDVLTLAGRRGRLRTLFEVVLEDSPGWSDRLTPFDELEIEVPGRVPHTEPDSGDPGVDESDAVPLSVVCLHDDQEEEDLELAGKLAQHLSQLSNAGAISLWRTTDVEVGDRPKEAIARQLELSDIVLVLLSRPFLEHYQDLLDQIDATRAEVLPVRLRPVDYDATPFAGRKALPEGEEPVSNWADPDEALLTIAKVIRQKAEARP